MPEIDQNLEMLSLLMNASTKRHEVHAANIANINTPNYIARELKFESAFRKALDEGGSKAAQKVSTEVVDSDSRVKADGNSVHLEQEYNVMQKNQMMFNIYAQMLKFQMDKIKRAIGSTA